MLDLIQVEKAYGSPQNPAPVLRGISLTIARGAFAVILGASGSGKSTLLHIASGLERPDGGRVVCCGTDITDLSDAELTRFRRDNVGFIFQQYYLLQNLTAEQNVRMGADLAEASDYRAILDAVGLAEKHRSYPAELSGGEQQRVAIARALAKKPRILFLDEPTGALDYQTGKQVLKLLQDTCRKQGMTVIIITHNAALVPMADRVVQVKNGTIANQYLNEHPVSISEIEW